MWSVRMLDNEQVVDDDQLMAELLPLHRAEPLACPVTAFASVHDRLARRRASSTAASRRRT